METTLKVKGMHCKSCSAIITEVINEIPGAKAISVDDKKGDTKVSYDSSATLEKIKAAIKKEGYTL